MIRGRHNRPAALVLAALWAFGPVAALLHESVTPHRYCAEHEELEDEESPDTERDGSRDPSEDHDRCAFGNACLSDRTLAKVVLVIAPPIETTSAVSPGAAGPHVPIPLLANAPKTSPPACSV